MQELKNIVGIIAVLLTFVGYAPYVRDTIKGKTKPHLYSWFIWGFVTLITFALQFVGGGGIGTFVTLAAGLVCFVILFFGLKNGKKDITKSDTVFFILALVALVLWLFAKQPVLSVILTSTIDMLGFIPTIRKSWNKPHTETLQTYVMNTIRFVLSLFALQKYTIVTTLFPITWLLANGLFSLLLVIRRKQML